MPREWLLAQQKTGRRPVSTAEESTAEVLGIVQRPAVVRDAYALLSAVREPVSVVSYGTVRAGGVVSRLKHNSGACGWRLSAGRERGIADHRGTLPGRQRGSVR